MDSARRPPGRRARHASRHASHNDAQAAAVSWFGVCECVASGDRRVRLRASVRLARVVTLLPTPYRTRRDRPVDRPGRTRDDIIVHTRRSVPFVGLA